MRACRGLWTVSLISLFAACKKSPALDTDTDTVPIVTTPTGPTGDPGPDLRTALEMRLIAFVGWDAATQEIVDITDDKDNGFLSAFVVDLFEVEGDFADSNRCRIAFPIAGLAAMKKPQAEGFVWGIDVPPDQLDGAFENCLERGFDPAQFEVAGSPIATWAAWTYRLRLGGELSTDNATWLEGSYSGLKGFTLDWFVQGGFEMVQGDTLSLSSSDDDNFWYGRPMNESHVVDFDTRRIKQDYITPQSTLSTGYYVFDQRVHYDMPLFQ